MSSLAIEFPPISHLINWPNLFGTKGVCDIVSSRRLMVIKGANPWRYEGQADEPYQTEHDEMYASIRAGVCSRIGATCPGPLSQRNPASTTSWPW